jgi:hypothetical protein
MIVPHFRCGLYCRESRAPRVGEPYSATTMNEPLLADHRNYYKVDKWTKDGARVERMLYAGSNLDKARKVFAGAVKHRPRIRLTIRQRTRVLQQWPASVR